MSSLSLGDLYPYWPPLRILGGAMGTEPPFAHLESGLSNGPSFEAIAGRDRGFWYGSPWLWPNGDVGTLSLRDLLKGAFP